MPRSNWNIVLLSSGTLVVVGGWLLLRKKTRRRRSHHRAPPPPPGPSLQDFGEEAKRCTLHEKQLTWSDEHGLVYSIKSPLPHILLPPIVVIGDVEVAKQLMLQQHKGNFIARDSKVAWATQEGEGLSITAMPVTNEGWKWRKVALFKEFHSKRMRQVLPVVLETAGRLCEQLQQHVVSKTPANVDFLTTSLTVHVILSLWKERHSSRRENLFPKCP
jgi:cytochrome P450